MDLQVESSGDRDIAVQAVVRDGLDAGKTVHSQVISESMSPFIRAGDRVQVQKVGWDGLQPGDILIVASPDGGLVTHRYIRSFYEGDLARFLTKGDRFLSLDPPWTSSDLIGRVAAIQRGKRELQIDRGWGGTVHRMVKALVLWEQSWVPRLPGIGCRRALHKIVRGGIQLVVLVAWNRWAPA